jgi:hypothetical protein
LAIQFACDSSSLRQSSRSLSASCGSSRTVMDLRGMVRGLRPAPLRAPPLVVLGVMLYLSWLSRVRHLLGDSCARVNNTVRRREFRFRLARVNAREFSAGASEADHQAFPCIPRFDTAMIPACEVRDSVQKRPNKTLDRRPRGRCLRIFRGGFHGV